MKYPHYASRPTGRNYLNFIAKLTVTVWLFLTLKWKMYNTFHAFWRGFIVSWPDTLRRKHLGHIPYTKRVYQSLSGHARSIPNADQCWSIKIKFQELIGIEPHWFLLSKGCGTGSFDYHHMALVTQWPRTWRTESLGPISEFWSLLIDIDQHWDPIQPVLWNHCTRPYITLLHKSTWWAPDTDLRHFSYKSAHRKDILNQCFTLTRKSWFRI